MSLNKLRLLNEDQLLNAIKESGHDDIAKILTNKGLNGQLFLECEELQAISWRLSRVQMKHVFTFINEVKANPAILVKSECTVRHLSKSKPALPYSSKPSSVVTPPKRISAIPSKPSFSNTNPKPLVTVKPQYKPALSQQKVSGTNIESTREQNEFKKKLGIVLGSVGSTPSPNVDSKPPKYPPTPPAPPKLENIQQVDFSRKPVKPIPTKPAESPEIDDKSKINKPFLPEPPRAKVIRDRLACPLPLPTKDLAEQSDSKPVDYGYLTPQDLNINYPPSHRKSFLHNKFHSIDDDDKDLYESPPTAELKVSPIGSRKPMLLPKDEKGSQRSSLSNDPIPVEDEDEDDEDNPNIYDHVDEPKTRYPRVKNDSSSYSLQKKCTVNDLDNVLIVDKDKRTNNFFGSLGHIGKFIVDKCKPTKQETPNYENHILQTEVSSISSTTYSFKDRPLPDIPNITTGRFIEKSASFSEISQLDTRYNNKFNRDREGTRKYVEEAKNNNEDDADDEADLIYENVEDENTKVVDEPDLPEYENKTTLNPLNRSRSIASNLQTKRPLLPDLLAYKISAELKARDVSLQKSNFTKLPSPEPPEEEQLIYGNVDEADEPVEEDMEEDQEDYIDSIFNINHEPFFRNIDRRGAKRLLGNFTDGAFLFRPSEKYFLVLTIKFKGKFHNLGIERRPNNMIRLNADMQSVSPEFGTLRAFVNYFSKEPVTFKDSSDNLVEVYLNPVLPADVY